MSAGALAGRAAALGTALLLLEAAIAPDPAWAYLDPGSGSIVVQVLLASVFSALFFFKRIWAAIKRGVLRIRGRNGPDGG